MDKIYIELIRDLQECSLAATYVVKNINYRSDLDDARRDKVCSLVLRVQEIKKELRAIISRQTNATEEE